MPVQEVIELHPTGWENDPEVETFRLSTIDQTPVTGYNHYMVFFRVSDDKKDEAARILQLGLETTLSQAKHYVGTIESDGDGGHAFVKKRDSTVKLVIQRLDLPEETHPSMDDLEKACFSCKTLGDLNLWSVAPMTWGEKPEANPDNSPTTSAFQINFIRGGIAFSMHSHHYASDVMGWSNFTRQLADNCNSVARDLPLVDWNPACIDVSRFTKNVAPEDRVDGPPIPQKHPGHPEQVALLFHLPQSKAAEIKKLSTPEDGTWISTYDAMCAFVWRQLSKVREPLHKPDRSGHSYWGEAVNMRPRIHDPDVPERMMRNVLAGAFSDASPVTQPTIGEVISDAPLWKLVRYIREMTESCTQEHLGRLIDMIAPIKDKRSISLRVDAHPPMAIFVTDHRPGDVSELDFGFGKPITYRHLWGELITAGLILIYAPIKATSNPDEGCVFTITMEQELVPTLLEDPEWTEYFEYRGVD